MAFERKRTPQRSARTIEPTVRGALDAIEASRHRRALLGAIGAVLAEYRRENGASAKRLILVEGARIEARVDVVDELLYEISSASVLEREWTERVMRAPLVPL